MLVSWSSLNGVHRCTAQCKKGAERKRHILTSEEERTVTSRAFSTYGLPLEMVTSFRYLGRVIWAEDDDLTAVVRNLSREMAVWNRMTRIVRR